MKKNQNLKTSSFLLVFIITFCFSVSAFSSTPVPKNKKKYKALTEKQKQEKRDSLVNNSDYIFYGRTDGIIREFTDDSKKNVYRVIRVYVHDVIRGPQEVKNTYIFRITKVNGYQYFPEYGFKRLHDYILPEYYDFVQNGYFFCNKNLMSLKYLTDSSYIHTDYLNIEMFDEIYGFDIERSFVCETTSNIVHGISIDDWNNKTYKGLYGLNFANQEEVINYLLPYGNITHPTDTTASEKKLDSSLLKSGSKKSITPEELENFNLWLQGNVQRNVNNRLVLKSDSDIVDCEFRTKKSTYKSMMM